MFELMPSKEEQSYTQLCHLLTVDIKLVPKKTKVLVANGTAELGLEELDWLENEATSCLVANDPSFFLLDLALDCIRRTRLAKFSFA